jgi:hypothetical protein
MRLIDLTGQTYGRLTVLRRAPSTYRRTLWRCRCSCGKLSTVDGTKLRSGYTRSCGCLRLEPKPVNDLTGRQFGKLTVLRPVAPNGQHARWEALCACGAKLVVRNASLLTGGTLSCGCLQRETATVHGHALSGRKRASQEYVAYQSALFNCTNPASPNYEWYGKRGIEFRFESFPAFIAALGLKPAPNYWLSRRDKNGHYEISNCEWKLVKPRKPYTRRKSVAHLQVIAA